MYHMHFSVHLPAIVNRSMQLIRLTKQSTNIANHSAGETRTRNNVEAPYSWRWRCWSAPPSSPSESPNESTISCCEESAEGMLPVAGDVMVDEVEWSRRWLLRLSIADSLLCVVMFIVGPVFVSNCSVLTLIVAEQHYTLGNVYKDILLYGKIMDDLISSNFFRRH